MKKVIVLLAFIVVNFAIEAQVKTPQASPKVLVSQTVGLTEIDLDYSRPSAKGRVIFGDLVPFGKVWRTGANANTLISFSDDVIIDGKMLPKGKYSLYTIPKADNWEVYFYKTTDNWGNPEEWKEADIALKANAKPVMLNRNVETFSLGFGNITNDSADLEIAWEKTMVPLKIEVLTQKMAIASITKALAGPTANDYYSAGQYYLQSNGDLNKGLEYLNKAVDMTKPGSDIPFWYLRQKSLIQAKLGDKKGAIETAKLSAANATKAKNDDYVKMNNDSIAEWSKK
jgi:tetratricopeptide (TPR) repeat protein